MTRKIRTEGQREEDGEGELYILPTAGSKTAFALVTFMPRSWVKVKCTLTATRASITGGRCEKYVTSLQK